MKTGVVPCRRAIEAWDGQLRRIAQNYEGEPAGLADNPTWQRLMRVRNSLRGVLRSLSLEEGEQQEAGAGPSDDGEGAGDQRRMRRAMERIR